MSNLIPHQLVSLALTITSLAAEAPKLLSHRATPQSREAARQVASFPADTREAVDRSLRYLRSQQNQDGSWGERAKVATTSLALLAILANGESPLSEQSGDAITEAIEFLVDANSRGKGRLGSASQDPQWPLAHALGTQALAESLLVCQSAQIDFPGVKDATLGSAQWIVDNAHRKGGWAPDFDCEGPRGGNLGLTVPLLHALWLAHQTHLETRNAKRTVAGALAFIEALQAENGAMQFAAFRRRPGSPMTGGCAFIYQLANRPAHSVPRRALTFLTCKDYRFLSIRKEALTVPQLLSFHYDALAVRSSRPKIQNEWFAEPTSELFNLQQPDGSFASASTPKPSRKPTKDEALQISSLVSLILQTPWRYHLAP